MLQVQLQLVNKLSTVLKGKRTKYQAEDLLDLAFAHYHFLKDAHQTIIFSRLEQNFYNEDVV
jgi:hypothetical protein